MAWLVVVCHTFLLGADFFLCTEDSLTFSNHFQTLISFLNIEGAEYCPVQNRMAIGRQKEFNFEGFSDEEVKLYLVEEEKLNI